MTLIDTILALIVVAGAVIGYRKGLIGQLATIVSFVLGIGSCMLFGDSAKDMLLAMNPDAAKWPLSGVTVHVVAVTVLFLVVALTVRVIGFFVKKVTKAVHLGLIDRIGGVVMCVFKWTFVLSVLLNLWLVISPNSDVFTTEHALNNKPFEVALDLMPAVLGNEVMPSDSLSVVKNVDTDERGTE